ncbi:sporulation membrane protein YtaF [Paenibacillus turpanensis]|uniref:sporulation membrane protein YtaF n=1 Tax=Paenibacillus turpanensis TaxID=2689078 RepID=UPI0014084D43|nr:sporulation membrane protein YtaF [Paenibacillus turpanensis]
MPGLTSLLMLSLAVSLDGFGVGMAYGLRKIRVPLPSILIIALCSGVTLWLSMYLGSFLFHFVPEAWAQSIGAWILIAVGSWAVYQVITQSYETEDPVPAPQDTHASVKSDLSVMQILKTPLTADKDRSGTISAGEAILLGFALSLDSLGAGIGAALLGLPMLATSLAIIVTSAAALTAGLRTGFSLGRKAWARRLSLVPGGLLIVMGILKLM